MRSLDPVLIVAGVSGSGKTTIATALAQRLGWPLQEGDELYSAADSKEHSAHPLDDRNQWLWLTRVAAWIDDCRQVGTGGVITCLALKRSHRDFLTRGRTQRPFHTPRPPRPSLRNPGGARPRRGSNRRGRKSAYAGYRCGDSARVRSAGARQSRRCH